MIRLPHLACTREVLFISNVFPFHLPHIYVGREGDRMEISTQLKEWTGESRLLELIDYHYGLHVTKAKPYKGVIFLRTDEGDFLLKNYRQENKIYQALDELQRNWGEERSYSLALPIKTKDGSRHFSGFHRTYSLLPWIKGKKPKRHRLRDWMKATEALASFHLDTGSLEKETSWLSLFRDQNWYEKAGYEANRLQNYIYASAWAGQPSELDQVWEKQAGYIRHLIDTARKVYEQIDGTNIEKSLLSKGKLCHGRFHRDNLLQSEEKTVFLDLHHADWKLGASELADWMEYAYGQTGSIDLVDRILQRYQEITGIEEEELPIIYCFSLFPMYYTARYSQAFDEEKSDEEQLSILQKLWRREQERTAYLHHLKELPAFHQTKEIQIKWI